MPSHFRLSYLNHLHARPFFCLKIGFFSKIVENSSGYPAKPIESVMNRGSQGGPLVPALRLGMPSPTPTSFPRPEGAPTNQPRAMRPGFPRHRPGDPSSTTAALPRASEELGDAPASTTAGAPRSCTVSIASRRCSHVTAGMTVAREFSNMPFRTHLLRSLKGHNKSAQGNPPWGSFACLFAALRLRVSDPRFQQLRKILPATGSDSPRHRPGFPRRRLGVLPPSPQMGATSSSLGCKPRVDRVSSGSIV